MKFIAHRGNIDGPSGHENQPGYILAALAAGYDAEIDLRVGDGVYGLGHDAPYYTIQEAFLLDNAEYLWIHCKNFGALRACAALAGVHYFWHESDCYTLTSKGHVFARPGEPLVCGGIAVMPEYARYTDADLRLCFGLLSDRVAEYKAKRQGGS